MKKKWKMMHKKIGRDPIPYVTCRLCYEQIRWDGMYPSPVDVHWQKEHTKEYNEMLSGLVKEYEGEKTIVD